MEIADELLEQFRVLPEKERKRIGDLLKNVQESFGAPHAHRGSGIRALGGDFYECRLGLKTRLIFENTPELLLFYMMGDHDEVQRFLKNNR